MKKLSKQFGGKLTEAWQKVYKTSPQWNGKKFENAEPISFDFSFQSLPKFLQKQFLARKTRSPEKPLPVAPFNLKGFLAPSDRVKYIWFGHSVVLLRLSGKTILIDPMFGDNASPIAPFATKRFSENTLGIIDQLPSIDLVLITHDHYDHLDLDSMLRLFPKVKQFYTSLGVERHLISWGVPKASITSFDWWDNQLFEDINIHFTPTQHASGRGLRDQSKCLWGGWVLETEQESIYFSGDGGYNKHFKEIGKRFKKFDIGFMECGQYNENWHAIHMFPEESVQAAIDTFVEVAIPVHWCGFALAQHSWKEPVERFIEEAKKQNRPYHLPVIGALNSGELSTIEWFQDYT